MNASKPQTVSEYIENAPPQIQEKARQLREIIKKTAPKAEEKLSYGMPYYSYHGRLIYFGLFKHHIGLYVMNEAREALSNELKPYHVSKATLHFSIDKPLPVGLIKKIVKAQVIANELKQNNQK